MKPQGSPNIPLACEAWDENDFVLLLRKDTSLTQILDASAIFFYASYFWTKTNVTFTTVHGVEYAFGAHDYPTSGVFEVEPRQCPGFKFRKSIFVGTTKLDPNQVREFIEHQAAAYNGDSYHLIVKNCNHFCKDICHKLTGKKIPKWVNRLAKLGNLCHSTTLYFAVSTANIAQNVLWLLIIINLCGS